VYLGGFGASHPLANKIGAWPAVLTAASQHERSGVVAGVRPSRLTTVAPDDRA